MDSIDVLHEFIESFPLVVIKPVDGSLGADMAIIGRCPRFGHRPRYWYRYYSQTRRHRIKRIVKPHVSWDDLQKLLPPRRFIVQQGISLARYRKCRFDIRVLGQKDRHDQWQITVMYARIARQGEYRTNLPSGARILPLSRALRKSFPSRVRPITRRVIDASYTIVEAFSRSTDELIGELALDIGIDTNGHPWLFEINSKPLRRFSRRSSKSSLSLRLLLEYMKMLSGN